nr:hypothetical protein Itr_chr08CG13470 [Ipomoea trifida]
MGWEMVGCPNSFPDADLVTCISVRIALVQTTLARVSFLGHESTLWFISFIYLGSDRLGLDHRGFLDYLDPLFVVLECPRSLLGQNASESWFCEGFEPIFQVKEVPPTSLGAKHPCQGPEPLGDTRVSM